MVLLIPTTRCSDTFQKQFQQIEVKVPPKRRAVLVTWPKVSVTINRKAISPPCGNAVQDLKFNKNDVFMPKFAFRCETGRRNTSQTGLFRCGTE